MGGGGVGEGVGGEAPLSAFDEAKVEGVGHGVGLAGRRAGQWGVTVGWWRDGNPWCLWVFVCVCVWVGGCWCCGEEKGNFGYL